MLKIFAISFLFVCVTFSCNDKKPDSNKETSISAEEFEYRNIIHQLKSLHKDHPDSFFVVMERLKVNMQSYLDTAGLWDCGEFSSSAYKIQIPHPSDTIKPTYK